MIRHLYRNRHDGMVGGVLAGLADYFRVDANLLRVGFLLLTFLTAIVPMVFFYLVAWIIVPERPEGMDADYTI
jgi:phage shock protein C